jgi:hypothetical protein
MATMRNFDSVFGKFDVVEFFLQVEFIHRNIDQLIVQPNYYYFCKKFVFVVYNIFLHLRP